MNYIAVIVTYNRINELKKSIKSLLNQKNMPTKILVVDNHSNDGTQTFMLDEYGDSDIVIYERLKSNLGGSGGFSYGVKKALEYSTDWIALSDDDAFYDENYFYELSKKANKYPDVKCFCGEVIDSNNNIQLSQRQRITNWNTLRRQNIDIKEYRKEYFYCDTSTFVGSTVSTNLIKKMGLPRNDFFIWIDDIEYSCRIRQYSKIMTIPAAKIYHKNTVSQLKEAKNIFGRNILNDGYKTYYGFRNSIKLRNLYSKNKLVAWTYTTSLLFLNYFLIVCNKNYKGCKFKLIKMFSQAYYDGYFNKLGKNNNYLPNKI